MSQIQIELSYDQAKVPWYRQRRVQRWAMWLAILVASVWTCKFVPPIWTRYRYYRIQKQAATYLIGPSQVLIRHSAAQPYNHLPGPADQFVSAFWATASEAHLSALILGTIPTATPIFCGTRTTNGGRLQIVQVYSYVTTTGVQRGLSIVVATSDWYAWNWVITGRPGPQNDISGCGIDLGDVVITTDPSEKVQVFSGVANLNDPSAVDVSVVINGGPTTLRFHVTEISKSPVHVGIATERSALSRAFANIHGWNDGGIWDWPFTGK